MIDNLSQFSNNASNDNQQPNLKIDAGSGTACTIGGPCTDSNGQASTYNANCNCIIAPPACTVGGACTDVNGAASTYDSDCNCTEVDNGVGTEADPAVTGASYTPGTVEVGQLSTLNISFANAGFSAIPANSIDITISTPGDFLYLRWCKSS